MWRALVHRPGYTARSWAWCPLSACPATLWNAGQMGPLWQPQARGFPWRYSLEVGIRPHDPSHEDRLRGVALGWQLWLKDRAMGGGTGGG